MLNFSVPSDAGGVFSPDPLWRSLLTCRRRVSWLWCEPRPFVLGSVNHAIQQVLSLNPHYVPDNVPGTGDGEMKDADSP